MEDKKITENTHETMFAGVYDRVNISIKTLDRIIFGAIILIVVLVFVSI
ncbi:MAG: hypothetical protein ACK5KQ_00525 [Anaerorhabdus sp.]